MRSTHKREVLKGGYRNKIYWGINNMKSLLGVTSLQFLFNIIQVLFKYTP